MACRPHERLAAVARRFHPTQGLAVVPVHQQDDELQLHLALTRRLFWAFPNFKVHELRRSDAARGSRGGVTLSRRLATRVMLGQNARPFQITTMDIDYVCVKAAMFSFSRLRGADPITGVEMARSPRFEV